ncbi:MFS transporter [Novosphingobium kunmingense]|uniref:MFS transporter n=1 Tax=Novosphingobium kunmingense TaxID=1211806 RepID=A0A2N0H619_9SPHN|nr:MFS transporter [Novosphingobium kunmingense]PKB14362.1 MFS transporter [Novosphingobium kunmingense]
MNQPQRMPWALLVALWVAEMTSSFESAMILAALRALVVEFGDAAAGGWLVTAFMIVGAAASALVGRLGDLYGRQQVLLIVLALGAAGSLLSAASSRYEMVLAGRILQGATTTILPLCIGLLREHLPAPRVPAAIGLMMSGASVGTAAGLVLGGVIVDHASWHGIFFASAAFCLASLALVRGFVPASSRIAMTTSVDWISGILFAPGVTLVLLYLTGGKAWGWSDPAALALLVGGAVLCTLWWRNALASTNPLIDVRSLGSRPIAVVCAASALVALGTLQITVFFSLLLQAPLWTGLGLGLSATAAGLVKLPSNITSILAGPFSGWLTGRGGGRIAMVTGGLVTTLGWILVLFDTSSVGVIVAELIVISFGTTMLFAVAPTIIAAEAPLERTSEVTGMLGVVRALFMGIGAQLVTTVLALDSVTRGTERYPSPDAYGWAVSTIIALTTAATLVALALPTRTVTSTP